MHTRWSALSYSEKWMKRKVKRFLAKLLERQGKKFRWVANFYVENSIYTKEKNLRRIRLAALRKEPFSTKQNR